MDPIKAKQQLFEWFDNTPEVVTAWERSHHRDQAWESDKLSVAVALVSDRQNYLDMFNLVAQAAEGDIKAMQAVVDDTSKLHYVCRLASTALCEINAKLLEEYRAVRELEG
jgi:hypothetical protein